MDFSIVAAVGSFVVSERVLKPKATVLVILGFVLAYDLTTKTQDVSSLRVYRGPSLVAFTLMMFAYSLRTWRRNGIACDELIFLPGTQHGHQIGIKGPLIESVHGCNKPYNKNNHHTYAPISTTAWLSKTRTLAPRPTDSPAEMDESASGTDNSYEGRSLKMITFRLKKDESNDRISIHDNTNQRSDIDNVNEEDKKSLLGIDQSLSTVDVERGGDKFNAHDIGSVEKYNTGYSHTDFTSRTNWNGRIRSRLQQLVERNPHFFQLWSFFFNRSGGSNNANTTYAPSGPAVFGSALDLSMPVLFNFHVFILSFNHLQRPDYNGSDFYAKTLPIAFLTVLYARLIIPPARRIRFWGTMKFTFGAPFYVVGVRDEFIGDCLTSWVRIGQDIVFATIYYFIVIWGTLSRRYNLKESGEILAESWCVHNVILPLVAILPLWLKYLQTLRQAYDSNLRWPYLGNSFKYLSATLVIIHGTAHPSQRRSRTWITCFISAMFYQIFWDIVMDWQLFEIPPEMLMTFASTTASRDSTTISNIRPNSRVFLSVPKYLFQPIKSFYERLKVKITCLRNIQLRQRRLYKSNFFYWKILFLNILTRFTWMLCFIPAYHISREETVVLTSTSDVKSYWGVLLPAAELFRRTLWGFLYLEKKTILLMESDSKYQQVNIDAVCPVDGVESDSMTINSKVCKHRNDYMPKWLGKQQQVAHDAATTRSKRRVLLCRYMFLFELYIWAVVFVILSYLVAR